MLIVLRQLLGWIERKRILLRRNQQLTRGAGVGRREKIGEEVATDPKMQQLQKKRKARCNSDVKS